MKGEPMKINPASESGFTLLEVLIAIFVLIFGLMAISNLIFTAGSSNAVSNQASAAATVASQQLEVLKAMPFGALTVGAPSGSLILDVAGCPVQPNVIPAGDCHTLTVLPGVGTIHTRWQITPVPGSVVTATPEVFLIQVWGQGALIPTAGAPLGAERTTAQFTTLRACVDTTAPVNCP
jgi:prepilin-type N-terminal cleavage/methylation domain-containing protein